MASVRPHPMSDGISSTITVESRDYAWMEFARGRLVPDCNIFSGEYKDHLLAELRSIERVLCWARTVLNEQSSATSVFPDEILAEIFLWVRDSPRDGDHCVPVIVRLSHVSRRWRSISLATSRLWTRLRSDIISPQYWDLALARSGSASLELENRAISPEQFSNITKKYGHRCRSLILDQASHFSWPSPVFSSLTSLYVGTNTIIPDPTVLQPFLDSLHCLQDLTFEFNEVYNLSHTHLLTPPQSLKELRGIETLRLPACISPLPDLRVVATTGFSCKPDLEDIEPFLLTHAGISNPPTSFQLDIGPIGSFWKDHSGATVSLWRENSSPITDLPHVLLLCRLSTDSMINLELSPFLAGTHLNAIDTAIFDVALIPHDDDDDDDDDFNGDESLSRCAPLFEECENVETLDLRKAAFLHVMPALVRVLPKDVQDPGRKLLPKLVTLSINADIQFTASFLLLLSSLAPLIIEWFAARKSQGRAIKKLQISQALVKRDDAAFVEAGMVFEESQLKDAVGDLILIP